MALTQATRQITIDTPLGEDAVLLRSFQGQEAISKLFTFDLDLVSEDPSIKYDGIVGQAVTVCLTLSDASPRYWNGYVSRFVQAGRDSNFAIYQATIVPWLWFLDQTTDCRIFQTKTAPDIIKQIFQEYGYHDFALRLYGDFVKRDYCVQYRESDFNFVSRLMEEEGIFYFFEHGKSKHTLVLGNDPAAHKECPNQPTARYEGTAGGWQDDDVVLQWLQEQEFRPAIYTATDYNFETPSTSLLSTVNGKGKWEVYDFPGEYTKKADGDKLVKVRLQEQQMPQLVARGTSDCRAFGVGYKFKLTDHYRDDLNQDYVLTAVRHSGRHNLGYTSGSTDTSDPVYENSFECLPATTPIRPPRRTPVPVVQGCQTAVVVGPGGEEIFTDQYGRVKVQFHWDREGKKNENSSCWVRVSYPWAGKGWGGIQIPRIGQEVIIDFIEGDPDRPIITGRTYNAGQMPPWDLPGKKTISGYKSNSTKGGGGYNELSFDDTKGTELIQVHGQYDMDTKIEHDERRHVVNNRTKNVDVDETSTIGNNRTEKVGNNEQITIGNIQNLNVKVNRIIDVGNDHTEAIHGSMSLSVDRTKSETVLINSAETIGGAKELSIGGLYQVTVGGAHNTTVGGAKTEEIGAFRGEAVAGKKTVAIGGDHSTAVGGKDGLTVAKDRSVTVAGKLDETVQKAYTLKAKTITLQAEDEIVISVGKAKIAMKKDGSVLVEGKDLSLKASGKINQNASGDIVMKGSKIAEN
jgi:type VI secretion system secreted protein VgrG